MPDIYLDVSDALYPPQLHERLHRPGPLHIACSDWNSLVTKPRVAVVGSRRPTAYGKQVTHKIATALSEHGIVIVSGLAFGIDAIAHRAALQTASPTLAVLPTPLSRIAPPSHVGLAQQIVERGGALVSSYPEGTVSHRGHFVARNEIVAALCDAVVITEAAAKSGSLHTASFALNMGVPVYAVPGNITSPLSEGCNNLLYDQARPISSIDRLLNDVGLRAARATNTPAGTPDEVAILSLLAAGMHDGNTLLTESKLDTGRFNQTMTILEIQGRIRANGGNQWSLER